MLVKTYLFLSISFPVFSPANCQLQTVALQLAVCTCVRSPQLKRVYSPDALTCKSLLSTLEGTRYFTGHKWDASLADRKNNLWAPGALISGAKPCHYPRKSHRLNPSLPPERLVMSFFRGLQWSDGMVIQSYIPNGRDNGHNVYVCHCLKYK